MCLKNLLTMASLNLRILGYPALLIIMPSLVTADDFVTQRDVLVQEISAMARATARDTGRKQFNQRVMEALRKLPRHAFVPPEQRAWAYQNRPLPIGHGQTISQPFIVALMTDLLDLQPKHSLLEIGTGSGYQAALLAEVVSKVYTIEIVEALGLRAKQTLHELGYRNIAFKIGDGYAGWQEHAPFDAIMVTAAPDHVPPALLAQLKPTGKMVLPVGQRDGQQELLVIEKNQDGTTKTHSTIAVRFVPLLRKD